MNIYVHIDELVVEGLPVTSLQGPRLKAAVEVELRHLLLANGLGHEFRVGGRRPEVRANKFFTAPGISPAHLGKQIASSVYGGIGKAK
jgi:hypothetical protein